MPNTAEPTVTQHLAASEAIVAQLKNADALVIKLRNQLIEARDVIEAMGDAAHPKLPVSIPYKMRDRDRQEALGPALCKMAVKRINATLGDRA